MNMTDRKTTIMNRAYIFSKDYDRMYELIQSGFRPVFRTEENQELRIYPFKNVPEGRECFLSTAKFKKMEFLDPASQSDYAECVDQLQEYKAYAVQAVSFMEKNAAENRRLRELLYEIATSAYPSKIIGMTHFLQTLREKCYVALNCP